MHDTLIARIRMCVPIISNCDSANFQNISVTLTFEEGTWFLDASQRCNVIDICAQVPQNMTKLQSAHDCCESGDGTHERTRALKVTHRLNVVDICAKLYLNPSMHDKITVGLDCLSANSSQKMSTFKQLDDKSGLDLEGRDMSLRRLILMR
jgi:hypothetical protein